MVGRFTFGMSRDGIPMITAACEGPAGKFGISVEVYDCAAVEKECLKRVALSVAARAAGLVYIPSDLSESAYKSASEECEAIGAEAYDVWIGFKTWIFTARPKAGRAVKTQKHDKAAEAGEVRS